MDETFTGFPPSGIAFLAGLAADNTKAYFDGNRDTRFSAGKTPYHPWVYAIWWAGLFSRCSCQELARAGNRRE